MIELSQREENNLSLAFGGDTLNTAVYLARLGVVVDYVTALGDDPWSDEMIAGWRAEGIGTGLVARLPGRLPGLYVIQTDAKGERRFFYWRDSAAARLLFDLPETPAVIEALAGYGMLYLSGITLSLYGEAGRRRLAEALDRARGRGSRVAFDTNFRPRGWPDRAVAQAAYRDAFDRADVVLASSEDLDLLFGSKGETELLAHTASVEVVLKLAEPACRVRHAGTDLVVRAEPVGDVVDTTAAGDSFNAAYLAGRLAGEPAVAAAAQAHRLAAEKIRHRGAIMPRATAAMH
jgi:2-dehydro-3-deoxygluconokinase